MTQYEFKNYEELIEWTKGLADDVKLYWGWLENYTEPCTKQELLADACEDWFEDGQTATVYIID